jgi:hypothetical protein
MRTEAVLANTLSTFLIGPGPSNWVDRYPACGGSKQSPVDIDTNDASSEPLGGNAFSFSPSYMDIPPDMSIENNGYTGKP